MSDWVIVSVNDIVKCLQGASEHVFRQRRCILLVFITYNKWKWGWNVHWVARLMSQDSNWRIHFKNNHQDRLISRQKKWERMSDLRKTKQSEYFEFTSWNWIFYSITILCVHTNLNAKILLLVLLHSFDFHIQFFSRRISILFSE